MFLSDDTRTLGLPADFSRQASAAFLLIDTLPEVCQRWNRDRKTVLMQIYKGRIEARQSGRTWLVFLPSVTQLWGNPPED